MGSFQNRTIEDVDTAFSWNGNWTHNRPWGRPNVPNGSGTYSVSNFRNSPYANVTFTFPVPGVAFHYFGLKRNAGGRYGICVDCNPNKDRFDTVDGLNETDTDESNPPVLLHSQRFNGKPAKHTVTLWNLPDSRVLGSGSEITVDRFLIEVPSNTMSSGSDGSSRTKVGVIAGGVVGGLAVVAVVVLGIWFWWRRKRSREKERREKFLHEGGLGAGGGTIRNATNTEAAPVTPFQSSRQMPGPPREVDAGPVEMQPPDYDTISGSRSENQSTAAGGPNTGTSGSSSRAQIPMVTGKGRLRVEN
ncbi:hypothetical protein D9756_006869 [Leucocoprinus leucothites]|uniref:receptor protein-tyrosine kinase n=1 Tax=Leucocoprinus leucothites TaxID=201217 RepID=A0A8H5LH27_9AGAR|nr:hypothetical protein D9756_006869 [Leucoagaricus leucothites]